ncbi:hypothetical protein CROQUDRAFT_38208 [Cronartium quercuum f. sp. fusiforme G11]|uniref:Trehalase n=1 Tax=Cronartium quercuum f. sp. fusiforme G11 TaxID=708437 RepID=A0A9P6TG79_9BASI|nr:hypothetical protein CROQUDRAFT_38208 [Cronartium quercuum f. sp. fusiforme G11]
MPRKWSLILTTTIGLLYSKPTITSNQNQSLINISHLLNLPLPPIQSHCQSQIFCPGHNQILQVIQLSKIFPDDKTFVDRPSKVPVKDLLKSFDDLIQDRSNFTNVKFFFFFFFYHSSFIYLISAKITDFSPDLEFFKKIPDKSLRGWIKIVHSYWKRLARNSIINKDCPTCESSQIPLNHPFIVPGGRFRENYYWDTFWILEGLLHSRIFSLAKSTLLNFLDEIELFGFIPNGARLYYLNRSQPPLFTQMLNLYVSTTNDTSLLARALPLVETELNWWYNNQRESVKSPFTSKEHEVFLYRVNNSAPRPEGYHIDFNVVWDNQIDSNYIGYANNDLSSIDRDLLYSQLASGAESGLDYSGARYEPTLDPINNTPTLKTLNIVDLNSIMYKNYLALSELYQRTENSTSKSLYWSSKANELKHTILDLFWDEKRLSFYDFNLTSNYFSQFWTPASYTPYWGGIYPEVMIKDELVAQKALAGPAYLTSRYDGSIPASLIETGLQWARIHFLDFPNVWPPQVYIVLQAYKNLPKNLTNDNLESFTKKANQFDFIPLNHFGINQEDELPKQPKLNGSLSNSNFNDLNNIGNYDKLKNKNWNQAMIEIIAYRFISSAFCSWYSTGGTIPGILPELSAEALNRSGSIGKSGHMFEKFNVTDINAAGGGGEYSVQDGFGWTNGIILTFSDWLSDSLDVRPTCPDVSNLYI